MAVTDFTPVYQVPLSGGHASGTDGFIDIQSLSPDNELTAYTSLDVARWEIMQTYENARLECSGNMGATDARRIGYSYSFRCEVIWDVNTDPELIFRGLGSKSTLLGNCANWRGLNGVDLVFWYGTVHGAVRQINPDQDPKDRYYWSPDAIIDSATPILDANGKRVNRVLIEGRFRAHVFLCPDQGSYDDILTIAGAYYAWWKSRRPS